MNATMVARISVNADSKLSIDFVASEILMFLTKPKTIAELLPPTMEPSRMLSSHCHPSAKWAARVIIITDKTNPRVASVTEKCAVFTMCLISRFSPPSNMIIINASAAKYGTT